MRCGDFRWAKVLATGALFVLVFGGCGESKDHGLDPEKPLTINVWTYYNSNSKMTFDGLVDEFNQTVGKEKGISVHAYSSGGVSELNEQIKTELEKTEDERNMPDLFGCYMDTAWDVEKNGLLVDLGDYFTEDELSEYVTNYIEDGYIDGKLKVLPVAKSTEIFVVNITEWNKFAKDTGASEEAFKTWEGITKTAREYYEWTDSQTETPNDGKAFFGRDSMANFMIVGSKQLGKEIFRTEEGKVVLQLDEEILRKMWDNYYVPYISGYFGSFGRFRSDDLQMGKIVAMTGSSTSSAFLPTEVTLDNGDIYPIETKVYALPNFEGTQEPYAVQQGAGMAISKSDETHEYAASLFLKWFTDVQQNVNFTVESSYLPVKKEASRFGYVKEKAEEAKMEWTSSIEESVRVALDQIQNYHLYNSQPFDNSLQARNYLENSLTSLAQADRETVAGLLDQGMTLEESVSKINTEQHFNDWVNALKSELKAACQISE